MAIRQGQVRPATRADAGPATEVLAEAFADSHTFRWIEPDDAARARVLRTLHGASVRHLTPLDHGSFVAEIDGQIAGVAVWAPPGRWQPAWWRQIRALPAMLGSLDRRAMTSLRDRGEVLDKALKADHPKDPHWYLASMAVSPAAQGTGLGSAVLAAGIDRCDREGMPAYLECEHHLIAYYAAHGFGVTQDLDLPHGARPQVGMWREPTAGST